MLPKSIAVRGVIFASMFLFVLGAEAFGETGQASRSGHDNSLDDSLTQKPDRAAVEHEVPFDVLQNVTLEGNVLLRSRNGVLIDFEGCKTACAASLRCSGFTVFPLGRCLLFDSLGERRALAMDAISGIRTTARKPDRLGGNGLVSAPSREANGISGSATANSGDRIVCPENFDTQRDTTTIGGDLVLQALAVSFDYCANRCAENKSCVGFVWLPREERAARSDRCVLKSRLRVRLKKPGALLCEKR